MGSNYYFLLRALLLDIITIIYRPIVLLEAVEVPLASNCYYHYSIIIVVVVVIVVIVVSIS